MQVAVVIVNYNSGAELHAALQSVAADLEAVAWEAVVVDNASHDGSDVAAEAFAPRVRLVRNAVNVGFGRAVNQGVRQTAAPLVLVLNPDCQLAPGAVAALGREIEAHDGCAVAGPKILDPDGGVQGSARGDPDMLTGVFGRTGALRRLLPGLPVAARNVVTDEAIRSGAPSTAVDWVSGACMLVRRDAFEAVGGFDERYFLYWEDADLCRRLRARGFHVRYVPGAVAVHRVGQSSKTAPAASIRAFHASAYRYYATHVAPAAFNPKRAIARALLAVRCRMALRRVRS
jgi:GT2 family glycosyltransferase